MESDESVISLASPEQKISFLDDALSEENYEKLEALAEAYGISIEGVLNVAISDQYDSKIASMRDAAG
jgi:hypothetical protein